MEAMMDNLDNPLSDERVAHELGAMVERWLLDRDREVVIKDALGVRQVPWISEKSKALLDVIIGHP